MEIAERDLHLENALVHLRDSVEPSKGIVAAALVDEHGPTYATSMYTPEGWIHAERMALRQRLLVKEIPLSPDAVMITTLSPCVPEDPYRRYDNCESMLLGFGDTIEAAAGPIRDIHIGALDMWQHLDGQPVLMDRYCRHFDVTEPADLVLIGVCDALFKYLVDGIKGNDRPEMQDFLDDTLAGLQRRAV